MKHISAEIQEKKMIKKGYLLFVMCFVIFIISGCGRGGTIVVKGSAPDGFEGGSVSVYGADMKILLGESSIDGTGGYSVEGIFYEGPAMVSVSASGVGSNRRSASILRAAFVIHSDGDHLVHVNSITDLAVRVAALGSVSLSEEVIQFANKRVATELCLSGVDITSVPPETVLTLADASGDSLTHQRYNIMAEALSKLRNLSLGALAGGIKADRTPTEAIYELRDALASLGENIEQEYCGDDVFTGAAWSHGAGWITVDPAQGKMAILGECLNPNSGSGRCLSGDIWGENIGWIQLSSGPGSCPHKNETGRDWGINIGANGYLTGYAWSHVAGWIKFGNDDHSVSMDDSGRLDGYAWGENIGWISFKGVDPSSDAYGVAKKQVLN